MNRTWMMAALAACLVWPAASMTQESPRARTRVRPRVDRAPYGVFSFSDDNRGRIGVLVDTRVDEAKDKIGARIEGVTPGGPAEKAGIKVGDVITRFNGTALGGAEADDGDASGPGMKLIELAHELEPGDTVQIEYRRGNDNRKATLVAEDLGFSGLMPEMGRIEQMWPRMQVGPGNEFEFSFGSPWGGIELVKLNPDLGEYFGTREGVLVVSAPEDSTLPLKGGDVITSIGGRKPTSPMHAIRILRSYDPGETVALEVMRKQKRASLSWTVPDAESRFRRVPRAVRQAPSLYRMLPKLQPDVWKVRDVIRTSRAI